MQTILAKGIEFLAFLPQEQFVISSLTLKEIIGECISKGVTRVLADEGHLTEEFFCLETLEAGEILQKFRTYGIRLAIVVSPNRLRRGRFKEMVAEENQGDWFLTFTDRKKAEEWLCRPNSRSADESA